MKALTYRNTKTSMPLGSAHESHPRGYAYETNTRFVHVYGIDHELWTISPGLTVSVVKDDLVLLKYGSLLAWVEDLFGATDVRPSTLDVGETTEGVWRPGLFFDDEMLQGLAETDVSRRIAEQALLLLIQRLDELLLYVEPTPASLSSYGHKSRELLILACTEVEGQWKHHLDRAGVQPQGSRFTTNDYVKLQQPLYLEQFEISLPLYGQLGPFRPFQGWTDQASTQSLPWYDAYNRTKHDPVAQFSAATLQACLFAMCAALVMFAVRFGPYRLFHSGGILSALFKPTFAIELRDCDPTTFYVPEQDISGWRPQLSWGEAKPISRRPHQLRL